MDTKHILLKRFSVDKKKKRWPSTASVLQNHLFKQEEIAIYSYITMGQAQY